MTTMILNMINIFILGFYLFTRIKSKKIIDFHFTFIISFSLIYFIGVLLDFALSYVGFISKIEDIILYNKVTFYSSIFIFTYLLFFHFPNYIYKINFIYFFPRVKDKNIIRFFSYFLILISLIMLIVYFIKNQGFVLLKSESYTERYSANLGYGYITIFFRTFALGFIILFLLNPSKKNFIKYLLYGSIIGILIYLTMGGYRQILFFYIFIFVILAYNFRLIKFLHVLIFLPLLILIITILAFIRYKITPEGDLLKSFLIFIYDTFMPIYSFAYIIDFFDNQKEFIGIYCIKNEFLTLIPRFIWENKPNVIINCGNFYTREILNYNIEYITISPTLLGMLYMSSGLTAIIIGAFFTAIIIKIINKHFRYIKTTHNFNYNILNMAFSYFSLFFLISIVREGLDVFIKFLLVYYFLTNVLFFFSIILYNFAIIKSYNEAEKA